MTTTLEHLNKTITKAHNYLYANEGLSNAEALEELLKLMYCKILIEQDSKANSINSDEEIYNIVNEVYFKLASRFSDIFEQSFKIGKETIIYIMQMFLDINFSRLKSDTKGHILQKVLDRSYSCLLYTSDAADD